MSAACDESHAMQCNSYGLWPAMCCSGSGTQPASAACRDIARVHTLALHRQGDARLQGLLQAARGVSVSADRQGAAALEVSRPGALQQVGGTSGLPNSPAACSLPLLSKPVL